jgi:alkylation response protein AidB-like acyl-CoA dehydrogenase
VTVNAALDDLLRLRLNPDQASFQREARAFLQEEMAPGRVAGQADPGDLTGLSEAFERSHHRRAGARGFLGIALPQALGGGGRPPSFRAIWMYEAAYHDAPSIDTAVVLCAGPLVHSGTAAQKQRWLVPMIRGEVLGCSAFTERNAGSDLAAVATRAEPAGDGWRLFGEKVLVTGAHKADVCVVLARTDAQAPARKAMSLFVLDLRQPGITIRRRPTMNGWTLSEITFNGAEVPADSLIGQPGDGFRISLEALADERSGLAWLAWAVLLVERLAAQHQDARVMRLAAETAVARRFCQRVMAMQDAGRPVTHEASVAKIYVTELLQRIVRLGADLDGEGALARAPLFGGSSRFGYELVERFHPTFSVGANELQRDAVVRFALDMPRA